MLDITFYAWMKLAIKQKYSYVSQGNSQILEMHLRKCNQDKELLLFNPTSVGFQFVILIITKRE